MHRSDLISQFISNINKKAEEAAQEVFNSYQEEFDSLIKREKLKGIKLYQGMGTATYEKDINNTLSEAGEKFLTKLAQAQYTQQNAGFTTKDII